MKTKLIIILLLQIAVMGANLKDETPIIRKSAERNGIKYQSDDWYLLIAIRKAENGRSGLEWGIMDKRANTLNKQAGWASATIMNHHKRTGIKEVNKAFIRSLSKRYCPSEGISLTNDERRLNIYWYNNVNYWYDKLRNSNNG